MNRLSLPLAAVVRRLRAELSVNPCGECGREADVVLYCGETFCRPCINRWPAGPPKSGVTVLPGRERPEADR